MKKIVVSFLLASGVALFSTMPMMSQSSTLSATEKAAQEDYFKALDAQLSGKTTNALKYIESAEKKLNKTNARLSYLKAKIYLLRVPSKRVSFGNRRNTYDRT